MTTSVTLLFFSGRSDPIWELAAGEAASLTSRIEGLSSARPTDILGYRGFLLRSNDPALPTEMLVRDQPELERFLLQTGSAHLPREVIDAVAAAIDHRDR